MIVRLGPTLQPAHSQRQDSSANLGEPVGQIFHENRSRFLSNSKPWFRRIRICLEKWSHLTFQWRRIGHDNIWNSYGPHLPSKVQNSCTTWFGFESQISCVQGWQIKQSSPQKKRMENGGKIEVWNLWIQKLHQKHLSMCSRFTTDSGIGLGSVAQTFLSNEGSCGRAGNCIIAEEFGDLNPSEVTAFRADAWRRGWWAVCNKSPKLSAFLSPRIKSGSEKPYHASQIPGPEVGYQRWGSPIQNTRIPLLKNPLRTWHGLGDLVNCPHQPRLWILLLP